MDNRLVKIALINMGYRKMRVNDDGVIIYGKPFANVFLRADVDPEHITLSLIFRSGTNREMQVYHSECMGIREGSCEEDTVFSLIEEIAIREAELYVNKASGCGSWPPEFNFITPTDRMAIETDL